MLIDENYANRMADCGVNKALVTILSHRGELHDRLTGVKGSWEKTIKAIFHLHRAGVEVILNLLMTSISLHHYNKLVEFCVCTFPFVKAFNFSAPSPTGRCSQRQDLWPSYELAAEKIKTALKTVEEHGIRALNPFCGFPLCAGWEEKLECCVEYHQMSAGVLLPGKRETVGLKNEGEKVHTEVCLGCSHRYFCGGLWRKIYEVKGSDWLSPPQFSPSIFCGMDVKHLKEIKSLVVVNTGNLCNENCIYCVKGHEDGFVSSYGEAKTLIAQAAEKGCRLLLFKGGEPTLVTWLPEAVRHAIRSGFLCVQILTNCMMLSVRDYCENLLQAGVTEILTTFWSYDSSVFDDVTKVKGSFTRFVKGMRNVQEIASQRALPVIVSAGVPLIKNTPEEVVKIVQFCKAIGIRRVFLFKPLRAPGKAVKFTQQIRKGVEALNKNMKYYPKVYIDGSLL